MKRGLPLPMPLLFRQVPLRKLAVVALVTGCGMLSGAWLPMALCGPDGPGLQIRKGDTLEVAEQAAPLMWGAETLGTIKAGSRVTAVDVTANEGGIWVRVSVQIDGKLVEGFLHSLYLKAVQDKGGQAVPTLKARIVFVGGDSTLGYALFRRDLTDPASEATRLTPFSFSKTAPAGKVVEEPIPSISLNSKPRWSPDGKRIAFIGGGPVRWGSKDEGARGHFRTQRDEFTRVKDIWVMKEDGQAVRPVVQAQVGEQGQIKAFRWSPDGNMIAFMAGSGLGEYGLYVADVNTRKIQELPRGGMEIRKHARGGMGSRRELTEEFCWAPDGKAIVGINTYKGMDEKICIVSIDGRCTDLTQGGEFVRQPYWWPDGKLTFCRGTPYADLIRNFWIMDSDGDNQARIREGRNIVEMPSRGGDRPSSSYIYPFWLAADGRAIAFESRSSDSSPRIRGMTGSRDMHELCLKKIDGSGPSKTVPFSLEGVFSRRQGEYSPYDVYFEWSE